MNTKSSALLASILLAAGTTIPATVSADSGFYIGAGVGNAALEIDLSEADIPVFDEFDENDLGYKVFAGYTWQLSAVSLGLEAAYTDFGKPSMDILGDSIAISASGLNLWGLAGIALGPVDLYGKIGTLEWDADITGGGESESGDGSDTGYGVGLRFNIGSFQVRGEYELFEIEGEADLTMLSVGVAYTF